MKQILTITLGLSLLSALVAKVPAAEFEKSKLRSDNSYIEASQEPPLVVYENNVVYEHGQLIIRADKLIKQGEDAGIITAEGSPVKIHHVNELGETTDIEAPKISYQQQTGELAADGDIKIIQQSAGDQLTLIGNKLRANQQITDGFGFVLKGSPTQFILNQPNQSEITAIADTLRSNGKDRKTQLVGSVKLTQGSSNTSAAMLTYDGETKRISATQSADGSQPVVTEFYWQDEPPAEKTETEKALEQEPQEVDSNVELEQENSEDDDKALEEENQQ
ncbi:LptA/OstA family protein [Kangiella sediminilitoris]|uniref:OstA family protein n=1 Tax=Kangiella sediminilitoris TaxID=1144748 RepID=A0A1B3BCL9_9GAMM|nr:LptA/OstA family protein [Kangiella sediminilitoris]AOE50503.1 OstA family protein [Kangiella sediminilitoris]